MSLIVVGLLGGCFASRPQGHVGFAKAKRLGELSGTYRNLGEGDPKETATKHYLSEIIWPGLFDPDSSIATIEVRVSGDTGLAMRALGDSGLAVKEQTFVAGKDFQFRSGRLRIYARSSVPSAESGGLFYVHETMELGIDQKGQGKQKRTESVIGAAYLVLPIALRSTTEVRFVRIGD